MPAFDMAEFVGDDRHRLLLGHQLKQSCVQHDVRPGMSKSECIDYWVLEDVQFRFRHVQNGATFKHHLAKFWELLWADSNRTRYVVYVKKAFILEFHQLRRDQVEADQPF